MDAGLVLLVPSGTTIPVTQMRRNTTSSEGSLLGGEEADAVLIYGNSEMIPSLDDQEPVVGLLPAELRAIDWDSYLVDDGVLSLLESEVNGIGIDANSTFPEWFMCIANSSPHWVLAFLWHWDEVTMVSPGGAVEALSRLRAVLRWDAQRYGFCVYGSKLSGDRGAGFQAKVSAR